MTRFTSHMSTYFGGSMSDITKEMLERRAETEQKLIMRAWSDEEFRKRLLDNPESVIAHELALGELPAGIKVQVIEEDSKTLYFLLPKKPAYVEDSKIDEALSESALDAVAGGGA